MNILVSGASGIVGYGILRSLSQSTLSLNLIGTTIYQDSIATAFCDIFELAPKTTDKNYLEWLLSTIHKHNVEFLIPGIEDDLYFWALHEKEIKDTGAQVLLNDSSLISLCKDKWEFFLQLNKSNLECLIPTTINSDYQHLSSTLGLPFLLKPKRGFASKGIVKVFNEDDFEPYKHLLGRSLMAQPIIGSDEEEYTCSAFGDGNGNILNLFSLKRTLSPEGFTQTAEVVNFDELNNVIKDLAQILKPIGPTNFQFRKEQEKFYLLEINPRVSSSTSIRTAFGYNESEMSVRYFVLNEKIDQPVTTTGKAVRYTEDYIYENRTNI